MSKRIVKRGAIGFGTLTLITLMAGWLFGWFSEDPAVAEVRDMQAKLADPSLKPDDRRAMFQSIRGKMESLSPAVRQELWDNNRQAFEKRMEQHVNELMAMSAKDRAKALDEDIDRMQKMQAQRQADAQNNPNAQNGWQQRQGNRGQSLSDDQRLDRMKNRMDRSTPGMRATRQAYVQMMDQRLKERGLPPMTGRPRPRG
jgi:hypothetical protein